MTTLVLIYHPDNWHPHLALPCDWAVIKRNDWQKAKARLTGWPDTHIVLMVHEDAGESKTIDTVAGLRWKLDNGFLP